MMTRRTSAREMKKHEQEQQTRRRERQP